MLNAAIRAAAAQFATSQLGTTTVKAVELGYLTGYAAGYVADRTARFPLPGDQAFKRLLGAYLGENITVYHPHSGRYGKLMGLPACYEKDGQPYAHVEFYADAEAQAEGCGELTDDASKLLPVLYAFEDLATEMLLPDGRRGVPAVEVAKLALGNPHFIKHEAPNIQLSEENLLVSFGKLDTPALIIGTVSWAMAWIDSDKDVNPIVDQLGVFNWLRAAGFAVGLAPHQYHRRQPGVDYASGGKPTKCAGCDRKEVCRA